MKKIFIKITRKENNFLKYELSKDDFNTKSKILEWKDL